MCSIYDSQSGAKLWPNANTPDGNIAEGSTFGDGLQIPALHKPFLKMGARLPLYLQPRDQLQRRDGNHRVWYSTVDTFVDVTTTYQ